MSKRFKVTLSVADVAFSILATSILNTIVSICSTSESSLPKVEITILLLSAFGGITIEVILSTISYSSKFAVPSKVNGMVISLPEATSAVAVNTTLTSEFSIILSEDNSKETTGSVSLSIIVNTRSFPTTVVFC